MIPFLYSSSESDAFKLYSAWVEVRRRRVFFVLESWSWFLLAVPVVVLLLPVSAGRCIRRDCVDDVGCIDEVEDGNDVCPAGGTVASGLFG